MTSIRILWRAIRQWSANGDSRLGAALAYYALFSIAPMVLIAIHITGFFFPEAAARQQVETQLEQYIGTDAAKAVKGLVDYSAENRKHAWGPGISSAILIFGALGAFLHLRSSLSQVWKLEPPGGNSILGVLLDWTLALGMVFIIGLLLLVSVSASIVVPVLKKHASQLISEELLHWEWIEWGISFGFLTLLFATIYRVLSGGRIGWGYVMYGSIIASLLFTLGKTLLGYYFAYSNASSAFGAAGSLVIFMMWVYYSSHVLFFGAELIQARRTRREWL